MCLMMFDEWEQRNADMSAICRAFGLKNSCFKPTCLPLFYPFYPRNPGEIQGFGLHLPIFSRSFWLQLLRSRPCGGGVLTPWPDRFTPFPQPKGRLHPSSEEKRIGSSASAHQSAFSDQKSGDIRWIGKLWLDCFEVWYVDEIWTWEFENYCILIAPFLRFYGPRKPRSFGLQQLAGPFFAARGAMLRTQLKLGSIESWDMLGPLENWVGNGWEMGGKWVGNGWEMAVTCWRKLLQWRIWQICLRLRSLILRQAKPGSIPWYKKFNWYSFALYRYKAGLASFAASHM